MRIGIFGGDAIGRVGTFDEVLAEAASARADGFSSFWLPQILGFDALSMLGMIGREVADIELGTGVIPTYPRHPMTLAAQALAVQAGCGDRLALGIGVSHPIIVENQFGMPFERPVRQMRDYLSILGPLLEGKRVDHEGEQISMRGGLALPDVPAPRLLVAALGTQMLRLTAKHADGTITWMTGPATLAEHTVPTITTAAAEANRPAPRVVAALPVCVTDDEGHVRDRAAKVFSLYAKMPSYRAMLDLEGASGPADVAIIGDEASVRAEIGRVAEAGVTDLAAVEFHTNDAERHATRDLLRSLV